MAPRNSHDNDNNHRLQTTPKRPDRVVRPASRLQSHQTKSLHHYPAKTQNTNLPKTRIHQLLKPPSQLIDGEHPVTARPCAVYSIQIPNHQITKSPTDQSDKKLPTHQITKSPTDQVIKNYLPTKSPRHLNNPTTKPPSCQFVHIVSSRPRSGLFEARSRCHEFALIEPTSRRSNSHASRLRAAKRNTKPRNHITESARPYLDDGEHPVPVRSGILQPLQDYGAAPFPPPVPVRVRRKRLRPSIRRQHARLSSEKKRKSLGLFGSASDAMGPGCLR